MTDVQKLALDALYQLGPMTAHELAVACHCNVQHRRGGFANTIISLFKHGWAQSHGYQIKISRRGIGAIKSDQPDPTSFACVERRL